MSATWTRHRLLAKTDPAHLRNQVTKSLDSVRFVLRFEALRLAVVLATAAVVLLQLSGLGPHGIAGWCAACRQFAFDYEADRCSGCGLFEPVRDGYCRLCWHQAREDGLASGKTGSATSACHFLDQQDGHHQLFFADMTIRRGAATTAWSQCYDRRGRPRKPPPPQALRPVAAWIQPPLFADVPRDYARFDPTQHPDPDNPWLAWARHVAHTLVETRGWTRRIRHEVDRTLVIVLSGHVDGDVVRYRGLSTGLKHFDITTERTAEVLSAMGILLDDRRRPIEDWLAGKLQPLARASPERPRPGRGSCSTADRALGRGPPKPSGST